MANFVSSPANAVSMVLMAVLLLAQESQQLGVPCSDIFTEGPCESQSGCEWCNTRGGQICVPRSNECRCATNKQACLRKSGCRWAVQISGGDFCTRIQ